MVSIIITGSPTCEYSSGSHSMGLNAIINESPTIKAVKFFTMTDIWRIWSPTFTSQPFVSIMLVQPSLRIVCGILLPN